MNPYRAARALVGRLLWRLAPRPVLSLRFRLPWLRSTERYARAPLLSLAQAAGYTVAECLRGEVTFRGRDRLVYASMANNFSSFIFRFEGARDPDIWRFIARHMRPGGIFVDVGANIGTYALPAALLVGPAGRVIAIEAHPLAYSYLLRNTRRNRLTQLTPLHLAVGEAEGEVSMTFESANPGETHVSAPGGAARPDAARVPLRPLDIVLREQGVTRVDYIKIDVEGFELPVLRGAVGTIAANADIIVQTELVERHAARYGHSIGAIAELLGGLGLKPFVVVSGTGELCPLTGHLEGDVLWARA